VTYSFDFANPRSAILANEVSLGLGFISRADVGETLRRTTGFEL
jgi:hypothetical protein